jgi:hypothetical protein
MKLDFPLVPRKRRCGVIPQFGAKVKNVCSCASVLCRGQKCVDVQLHLMRRSRLCGFISSINVEINIS